MLPQGTPSPMVAGVEGNKATFSSDLGTLRPPQSMNEAPALTGGPSNRAAVCFMGETVANFHLAACLEEGAMWTSAVQAAPTVSSSEEPRVLLSCFSASQAALIHSVNIC